VDIEDKIQSAAHDHHGQDAALTTEQVIHERQQQVSLKRIHFWFIA
jgi:hypothetical protein